MLMLFSIVTVVRNNLAGSARDAGFGRRSRHVCTIMNGWSSMAVSDDGNAEV